jgi:MFS family permease
MVSQALFCRSILNLFDTSGLIPSLTLVNSIIFTLIASFYADRLGRRKMLIIYSGLDLFQVLYF